MSYNNDENNYNNENAIRMTKEEWEQQEEQSGQDWLDACRALHYTRLDQSEGIRLVEEIEILRATIKQLKRNKGQEQSNDTSN